MLTRFFAGAGFVGAVIVGAGVFFWVFPISSEELEVVAKEKNNIIQFKNTRGFKYKYKVDQGIFDEAKIGEKVLALVNIFTFIKEVTLLRNR